MSQILALVPSDAIDRLRRAARRAEGVLTARSVAEFREHLADQPWSLVVIDPTIVRDDVFEDVLGWIGQAGLSTLIWTACTPVGATRALAAARAVAAEVLIRGPDDDIPLRRAVMASGATTAAAMILREFADRFLKLPENIRTPSVALFGGAPIPQTVDRFVEATGLSHSTVERHLREDAQIRSAKRLLDVARVARAYTELSRGHASLEWVAHDSGYGSVRTLRGQFRAMFDVAPHRVAQRLAAFQFIASIHSELDI